MRDNNQTFGVAAPKASLRDLLAKFEQLAKEGKDLASCNSKTSGLNEHLQYGSLSNAAIFDMVLAIPSIDPDGHKEGLQ